MAAARAPIVTIKISGPLERSDLPGLYQRACALLECERPAVLRCELDGLAADAVAVDALARLALAARRQGCAVRLCDAREDLYALVRLMGLEDVLVRATS